MSFFSGFLASSQVLELWDRILAFDSLEVLASKIKKNLIFKSSLNSWF
jgi:hypothetical protein